VTTRVYLIRHGATELTAEDHFAGAIDRLVRGHELAVSMLSES